jgi:hypothetical protein
MQIIRLIYASVARPDLPYSDLTSILRTAATHNASNSITGMLCYTGDAFLQVLEGHRSDVNRLYNRIARDKRHGACELLSVAETPTREFADWSMKLIRCDGAPAAADRRAVLLRHTETAPLEVRAMSAAAALSLMSELALLERAPRLPRKVVTRRPSRTA